VLIQNYHPVQLVGTDRMRTAAFYATSAAIHCITHGTSSDSALAATSVTYDLLLFRPPLDGYDPDLPVFSSKQGILAKGIIKATDKLLRRADAIDASPFDVALGPAADVDRGSIRFFQSNGTVRDFGPYGGSGAAPEYIQCAVTE
jgi:hypothetical protein